MEKPNGGARPVHIIPSGKRRNRKPEISRNFVSQNWNLAKRKEDWRNSKLETHISRTGIQAVSASPYLQGDLYLTVNMGDTGRGVRLSCATTWCAVRAIAMQWRG